MAYANKKGYDGEVEFAKLLTDAHIGVGDFKFVRVGGVEKFKKVNAGDVVIIPSSDPYNLSFLRNYFLEAKKRSYIDIFSVMKKAEDDAKVAGKYGAICYVIKQKKGEKREDALVVLSKQSFIRIIKELQGYIYEDFQRSRNKKEE
jgi:hypothetical protein